MKGQDTQVLFGAVHSTEPVPRSNVPSTGGNFPIVEARPRRGRPTIIERPSAAANGAPFFDRSDKNGREGKQNRTPHLGYQKFGG